MRQFIFKWPTCPFDYTVTNRARVTKRIHMELDKQGGLVVVAPRHWSKARIDTTLVQNMARVERFLVKARKRQQQPLLYTDGESHLYLGERYPLVINKDLRAKSSVILSGDKVHVTTRQQDPESIRLALRGWYLCQARRVFSARLLEVAARADWVGDRPIPLKLRRMKRTWGNCSSSGVIKLNTHLIKAPLAILDSVIAHELCHLQEMNHGRAFYSLLERLNPDWKEARSRLISEGNLYLQ